MTVNILTKHYAAFLVLEDMARPGNNFPDWQRIYNNADLAERMLTSVYGDYKPLTDCQTKQECDAFRRACEKAYNAIYNEKRSMSELVRYHHELTKQIIADMKRAF